MTRRHLPPKRQLKDGRFYACSQQPIPVTARLEYCLYRIMISLSFMGPPRKEKTQKCEKS